MIKLRALNSSLCSNCKKLTKTTTNSNLNSIFISFYKTSTNLKFPSVSVSDAVKPPSSQADQKTHNKEQENLIGYLNLDASSYYFNNFNHILNYNPKQRRKQVLQADSHSRMTQPTTNYFAHSFIDRCSDKRKDKEWIREQMTSNESIFILFHVEKPFVSMHDSQKVFSLYRFKYDEIKCLLESDSNPSPVCIFLGLEYEKNKGFESQNSMSSFKCQSPYSNPNIYNKDIYKAWFAIDIANEANIAKVNDLFKERGQFSEGNFLRLMAIQDLLESSVIAQARSVFCWIDRNKHCASCGVANQIEEAGFKLACKNTSCKSNDKVLNKHSPSNIHYPRVDPVVIMLIINPEGTHVLLGRKKQFPKNMFSCLAGYVEAGESIEEAVRRESFEESGIYTDRVVYQSSQPWPFPSTLMIGCYAYGCSTDLKIDENEIEHARWFSAEEINQILNNNHPEGIFIPTERTIAHQLIKQWNTQSKL